AMKPWLTRGRAEREAAWTRLSAGSEAFRRAERRFAVVWGVALLAECVVRVLLAYTVPVDTMVWLGVVLMIVTMSGTFLVSGARGAGRMAAMIAADLRGGGPAASLSAGAYTVTASADRTEPRDPADGTDGTDGTDRIDRAGTADRSAKP